AAQAAPGDPVAGGRPHPGLLGQGRLGHLGITAPSTPLPLLPGDAVGWAGPGTQTRPIAPNGEGAQGRGHPHPSADQAAGARARLRPGDRRLHPGPRPQDLDASALAVPMYEMLPATDSRVVSTVRVLQEKLSYHGFLYR